MGISDGLVIAFITVISAFLLFSVVCNIMVLLVMIKTPKMMNPTNIFICNLTVSDILLSGIVVPQNIHDISHSSVEYFEGDLLCRIVNFCPILCIMASIYSMVAISFERKRAIVVISEGRTTVRQALLTLPVIWCLSFLFCLPTIYEFSTFWETADNRTILACGSNGLSWAYSVLNGAGLLFVAYVIPCIMLLVNYGSILMFFRSRGVFGSSNRVGVTAAQAQALYKGRMKVVKMLMLVAVLFAISWLPYFALQLHEKISGTTEISDIGPVFLFKIILTVFSSTYNFFLYVVYNKNFRNGFRALFTRRKLVIKQNSVVPADFGQSYAGNPSDSVPNRSPPAVFALSFTPRDDGSFSGEPGEAPPPTRSTSLKPPIEKVGNNKTT